LRDPEADLELAILSSRLRIMVLGHPPLSKEMPGIVAIIGVERIRRRVWHERCSIRGLAGPGERTKTIIQDEPINELEKYITMNRRYRSHLMRRRC